MHNWNTNITRLKKNPKEYEKFVLEQRINFGLNNHKLSLKLLKKHWNNLVIDPAKKAYLDKIVWQAS